MNNRDLNSIAFMKDATDDPSVSDGYVDDEDEDSIEVDDIKRHFWTGTNDIRYKSSITDEISDQMQADHKTGSRASEVPFGLIASGKAKNPRRMSYHQVQRYLILFGVQGSFAE